MYRAFLIFLCMISSSFGFIDYNNLNPAPIYFNSVRTNQLRLFLTGLGFDNNFLDIADYERHFYTDPNWDILQKNEILSLIPVTGVKFSTDLLITPLQFYSRYFNIGLSAQHYANINLAKDLFDLALFGNQINHHYNFSSSHINNLNYLDASLGITYPISRLLPVRLPLVRQLNIGARLHYQKGLFITQTDSANGYLYTTPFALVGYADLFQSMAQNSNCYAFDFGLSALLPFNIIISLAYLNVNTGFTWQKDLEQLQYRINIDSFSLARYLDFKSIDSFYFIADSSSPIQPFTTKLPEQFLISSKYQPIPLLELSVYYHKYQTESSFITDYAQSLTFDLVLKPCPFFYTAISLTSDLHKSYRIGHRVNLISKKFMLDLHALQSNGYLKQAKGINAGVSINRLW